MLHVMSFFPLAILAFGGLGKNGMARHSRLADGHPKKLGQQGPQAFHLPYIKHEVLSSSARLSPAFLQVCAFGCLRAAQNGPSGLN